MTKVRETSQVIQPSTHQPAHDQPNHSQSIDWPDRILAASATLWFVVVAVGQWIFVCYVAAYYLPVLVKNGLSGLGATTLPEGYVAGDTIGNLAIAFHVLVAIIIIGGGPLQLISQIRSRFPTFHHYLGRIYMTTAVLTSIAGLYVVWTRGVPGGMVGHIGISLDAVLIIAFAAIAIRFAMARQIHQHRRWAMRLFMVVSAVWFFRIGLMFWFITTGGIGIDSETFEGPFLSFMYFGQMALPLLILEIYFWAQDHKYAKPKFVAAFVVLLATGVTAIGSFAATIGMWLPRL